jgi:hypothetical protein
LSEALPGYEVSAGFRHWRSEAHAGRGHRKTEQGSQYQHCRSKFRARLANLGGTVLAGSPADFGKLISDETKKWGKVIVTANIKSD